MSGTVSRIGPGDGDAASVTVRAAAKINLHLGVGAVGSDGFHPLATVYQAVGLYDDVTVSDAAQWQVHTTAEEHIDAADIPAGRDNLAVRAGVALTAHHGVNRAARIEIHKGIPVAGGLAGGSADAAATLVALDRLWELATPDEVLLELAGRLGSDVPFALLGATAAGHGHGELVEPVRDHGRWWWVVVGHADGLSTPAVYEAFDADHRGDAPEDPEIPADLLAALASGDVDALGAALGNDLQAPALRLRPELARTVADADRCGAVRTLLSGSGPTVLLLARDADHARELARSMAEAGHDRVGLAPAPVAGAHVITYA